MAEGYAKLLTSILSSSIWREPDDVVRVWITMLAMADKSGYVAACADGIAHMSRTVSEERVLECLDMFSKPDPRSRSEEFEGRRIQKIARGWLILNYKKIRDMHGEALRKARDARYRSNLNDSSETVEKTSRASTLYGSGSVSTLSSFDLSSDSDARARLTSAPETLTPTAATLAAAERYGRDPVADWEACRDWAWGKGERKADWQATLRGWMKRSHERNPFATSPIRLVPCPDRIEFTERHRGLAKRASLDPNLEWADCRSRARSAGKTSCDWQAEFESHLVRRVGWLERDAATRNNGPLSAKTPPVAPVQARPAARVATAPKDEPQEEPGGMVDISQKMPDLLKDMF